LYLSAFVFLYVCLRILPQLVTWARLGSAELSSGHLSLDPLKLLDISILVEALYKNTSLFIHKHDTVTVTVLRVTCRRLNRLILADITYVVIPTDTYHALFGASAIAANGLLRYSFGAVFPLFTLQL
jgi:hypothetical protein